MKYLGIWLVRFYRKCLSPLKRAPCCRFVPSCSAYAEEAFRKRGFFVGLILTVLRILRCNPYCAGGYDPVPEKGLRYRGSRVIPAPDDGCSDGSADSPIAESKQLASEEENDEASASTGFSKEGKEKHS